MEREGSTTIEVKGGNSKGKLSLTRIGAALGEKGHVKGWSLGSQQGSTTGVTLSPC